MIPSEIRLHTLIEYHAAPYGYAIMSFEYFEQDGYYKVRLDRFDKTHPITLIVFPDELLESVNRNKLSSLVARRFDGDIKGGGSTAVA